MNSSNPDEQDGRVNCNARVATVGERWPVEELESVSLCPACGLHGRTEAHSDLVDRVFRCAPGRWTMYECVHCKSGYLDPRPDSESIGRAYETYYTHRGASDGRLRGRLRRFLRSLSNWYLNARFGVSREPACRIGALGAFFAPGRRGKLEIIGRHLPRPGAGDRLLDVGCGSGEFLAFAYAAGWRAEGVDPDRKAVEVCRAANLEVAHGDLDTVAERGPVYSVITMSHVIEHVHEPRTVLQHCLQLLRPGGVLWLETPNMGAQGRRKYGDDWRGLEPPRHLTIFSREALVAMLKDVGFVNVTDALYRPLCRDLFAKSRAIARGADPYVTPLPEVPLSELAKAELRARINPAVREFITLLAYKPI